MQRTPARSTSSARRRRWLTSELILSAALEVLDEDGVDAFNMRAVAARLGTGAASLYRYVASKDELLDLVVEDAIGNVRLPADPLPWRTMLTELAHELRRVFMSRRDLARIAMTSTTVSPNSLRIAESALAALSDAGCRPEFAAIMLDRLSLYVTADAFENSLFLARMTTQEAHEYWNSVASTYGNLEPATYPHLVAHASVITQATPEERFAVGLDTILDGIGAALGQAPPSSAS
jgi:AcrR family transcriptional regulator